MAEPIVKRAYGSESEQIIFARASGVAFTRLIVVPAAPLLQNRERAGNYAFRSDLALGPEGDIAGLGYLQDLEAHEKVDRHRG